MGVGSAVPDRRTGPHGMKVAYLVNQYPRPTHTFIRREIDALERKGVEVLRFSVRRSDQPLVDGEDLAEAGRTEVLLDRGLTGILLPFLRRGLRVPSAWLGGLRLATRLGLRSRAGLLRHWAYLGEACLLLERTRALRAEHVHAHFGTNAAAVAMYCRALGGPPYSFTVHGPEEFDGPVDLALAEKAARARFVASISGFCRSQVLRWCAEGDWGKVHVVRCGLDSPSLRQPRVAIGEAPRLVNIGRLAPEKGHRLLLESAQALARTRPDFELTIVGDGPLRGSLEDLARRRGLERCVRFAGWLPNEEVRRRLLESRALVLSSFAEGLPVVAMEAMALGRPVVGPRLAGLPELVRHGVNGWLVTPGEADELASAMGEALAAPVSRLEELGEEARKEVARRHCVEEQAALLHRLIRSNGGAEGRA